MPPLFPQENDLRAGFPRIYLSDILLDIGDSWLLFGRHAHIAPKGEKPTVISHRIRLFQLSDIFFGY